MDYFAATLWLLCTEASHSVNQWLCEQLLVLNFHGNALQNDPAPSESDSRRPANGHLKDFRLLRPSAKLGSPEISVFLKVCFFLGSTIVTWQFSKHTASLDHNDQRKICRMWIYWSKSHSMVPTGHRPQMSFAKSNCKRTGHRLPDLYPPLLTSATGFGSRLLLAPPIHHMHASRTIMSPLFCREGEKR